jgi:hypothetical protein
MNKICTKCNLLKDISCFGKVRLNTHNPGVDSHCKNCNTKQKAEWYKHNPWALTHKRISDRCIDKKRTDYHGKNIKNFLHCSDLKMMWYRDKAYLMKKPSIDRINPNGNYEISNCRYLEHSENSRRVHEM